MTTLQKTTEYRKDKHLESTRENLQAFFKEYDLIKKDKKVDGSFLLYVQKKRKCKNCVWWIELEAHPISRLLSGADSVRIGACGEEDNFKSMIKRALKKYNCRPDDPNIWAEKFVSGEDSCFYFRRWRRTIGGQPIDERKSIFLQKTFKKLKPTKRQWPQASA